MAKTETKVNNLKINRGTYADIQANIGQIGENELIIVTDKQVPIPQAADEGKVVKVNASGEYELGVDNDTTYENKAAAQGGTAESLVTTGEKYIWNNKQDALVSGTNIKTINNESILGSGNIVVASDSEINVIDIELTEQEMNDFIDALNTGDTTFSIIKNLDSNLLVEGKYNCARVYSEVDSTAVEIMFLPFYGQYVNQEANMYYLGWVPTEMQSYMGGDCYAYFYKDYREQTGENIYGFALAVTEKNSYSKEEINTLLANKQDTLVSGTNIKTIKNTSVLGSGNIDIFSTVAFESSQVVSQNPLTIQLTDVQYDLITEASYNEKTIIFDASDLGIGSVTAHLMYISSNLFGITDCNPSLGEYYKFAFTDSYDEQTQETTHLLIATLHRFIVDEVSDSDISSGNVQSGYVLTADGQGGAEWLPNPGSGDASLIESEIAVTITSSDVDLNSSSSTEIIFNSSGEAKVLPLFQKARELLSANKLGIIQMKESAVDLSIVTPVLYVSGSTDLNIYENFQVLAIDNQDTWLRLSSIQGEVSHQYSLLENDVPLTMVMYFYKKEVKVDIEIPTIEIAASQVISQEPLQIQLTNEQYSLGENKNQILVDITALGLGSGPILFNKSGYSYSDNLIMFYTNDNSDNGFKTVFDINPTTKVSRAYQIGLHLENVAITSSENAGKVLTVNANGGADWQPTIPTVAIELSQVISQDPVEIQLTDAQYNLFLNNRQVIVDVSALEGGFITVIWEKFNEDTDTLWFGTPDLAPGDVYYFNIVINKSTKIGTYEYGGKMIEPALVRTGNSSDDGKLLAMDANGEGKLTNNLPILTTAPTSANTEGGIIIVVLSQEPQQKFSGFLYLITSA